MSEETVWVKAPKGILCPREDNTTRYITDAVAVQVPLTSYYIRRLRDGDIVKVDAPKEGK